MLIRKPAYYDDFHCLAGQCPDTCCKDWIIDVDDASAAYWRTAEGPDAFRAREALEEGEFGTVIALKDGYCPLLRQDGLCSLGVNGLCDVCRKYPRLTHDYGAFQELQIELSCPEAARLIMTGSRETLETDDGLPAGEAENPEVLALLLKSRDRALEIMSEDRPMAETLALLLLYGSFAQAELEGIDVGSFDGEKSLDTARKFAEAPDTEGFLEVFRGFDILTPQWRSLLEAPRGSGIPEELRPVLVYLIRRWWLQAVSDGWLAERVKFIVCSCILIGLLGGELQKTAYLFSKEVENDCDIVDELLEDSSSVPAFTDSKLLGMLLGAGR